MSQKTSDELIAEPGEYSVGSAVVPPTEYRPPTLKEFIELIDLSLETNAIHVAKIWSNS